MDFDYRARQREVSRRIQAAGLDALLVTHLPNVRYLSGFAGSNGALALGKGKPVLFTDGRYTSQAREQAPTVRTLISKGALTDAVGKWLGSRVKDSRHTLSLGIEADRMTVATRHALQRALPRGVRLREAAGLVESVRAVKDAVELQAMRRAAEAGTALLEIALAAIRPGVREVEVAAEIEYAARRAGAEGMSFETIVAAGPRSALPHGRATASAIPQRGFVVLDFGVILAGYCSDMTRTVHVGRASDEDRRLYEAVREAQLAAKEAARAGVPAGAVDAAARSRLQRAGWGRYFTHSTGHGVGLEIHEAPRVARGQKEVLRAGTVVTIEPGAYLPGKGGVRIEDTVVITDSGCEVLTSAARELIEL